MLETQGSLFGRLDRPASVVLFSGLGGACEGIRRATGASPLGAINHWPYALRLHALNHPETAHYPEDVWQVPPALASRGRRLKLLWMSPDCTHFSRAKGGQPREKERRSLANVAFPWVEAARPAVLMLENVPEFEHWGPLYPEDHPNHKLRSRPNPERRGEHFREWVAKLRAHGYQVEWRQLVAADFGAPTTRKRLYLIARCDGQPIRWPEPTHGPGRAHPWRTAAECIDWDIPAPSIFERKRPLADATDRRIAAGLVRYVLEAREPGPYIVATGHQSSSPRSKVRGTDEPLSTVVTKAEHCLAVPYLIQTGYGERKGQAPRVLNLQKPVGTIVAGGAKRALCMAWLTKFYGSATHGASVLEPAPTVTTGGGKGGGHLGACTATAIPGGAPEGHARAVAGFLVKYYGSGVGQELGRPLDTVTTVDRFGLVQVHLDGEPWTVVDIGLRMLQPRELARAMGFPDSYQLIGTKRQQVEAIGNAVCPPVARALVAANIAHQ